MQFCPLCQIVLDLHDGPDSCESAEMKARLLEEFDTLLYHLNGRKDA